MTIQKLITYTPLDLKGTKTNSTKDLKLEILETSGNYLLHKDIVRHFSLQKQGTLSTKTRSEVSGGGKKPWQQKGTGRARAGSNRSPLWRGGGVIFGPKPKKLVVKLNKKERRLALQTLLYNKKTNIVTIENLETLFTEPKTKTFLTVCKNCQIRPDQKILVVTSKKTIPLKLATQNLKNVELILASNLNTLSLLKAQQIIITTLAIDDIKETYCD